MLLRATRLAGAAANGRFAPRHSRTASHHRYKPPSTDITPNNHGTVTSSRLKPIIAAPYHNAAPAATPSAVTTPARRDTLAAACETTSTLGPGLSIASMWTAKECLS